MNLNFHEDLKRTEEVHGSSDRNFGFVFAGAFTFLSLWPLRNGGHVRIPLLGIAAVFLLIAVVMPRILGPLNKAWAKLGLLMGRVVNPIVTAILFFAVFTPAGIFIRLLGKDPLRLKPSKELDSYWIVRNPPGPQPDSMSKQF